MKLLIGYDGSEYSDRIFEDLKRAGLPREMEAFVGSVGDSVINSVSAMGAVGELEAARETASAFAERGAARLQTLFPDWQVRRETFIGSSPAWILIDAADKLAVDLIVVGSQGRGALGRLLLGSVSKKIATDAKCSVRVARFSQPKDESEPPRVIVGVDGSPAAEQAVYAVGQRVWQDGTEVKLIAARDSPPNTIATRLPQAGAIINEYISTRQARISSMLDWATEELNAVGLKTSVLTENGDAKTVLLAEAEKWNADSIFVGTRDFKSAFERFRLGSVSTGVLTDAHCSVEIVRPPQSLETAG